MLVFDVFIFVTKNVFRSVRLNMASFSGRLLFGSGFCAIGLFSLSAGIPMFKIKNVEPLKGIAYVRLQDDASDLVLSQIKLQAEQDSHFQGHVLSAEEFYDRVDMPKLSEEEKNQWQPRIIEFKVFGSEEISSKLEAFRQNPNIKSVDFIESPAKERNQVSRTILLLFLVLSSLLFIEGVRILKGAIQQISVPLCRERDYFNSFGASPIWASMTSLMTWTAVVCPVLFLQVLFYFGATKVPQVKSVGMAVVQTVERLSLSK